MIKTFRIALLCSFLSAFSLGQAFASNKISASEIPMLGYDPNSEAMGGSILSFSQNSLSFLANPSANFSVLGSRLDFSGIAAFDGIYGGAAAFLIPTQYGNITAGFSYNNFGSAYVLTPDGTKLTYSAGYYINYVYPFATEMPVYTELGGAGATLKVYQFATDEDSQMTFALDFGAAYYLNGILDGLWASAVFRNLGSSVQIGGADSFDLPSNFDLGLRYEVPIDTKLAFTGDVIHIFAGDGASGGAIGAEISPVFPVTLKIGYRDYGDKLNEGMTAGLFINLDSFNLGYSFAAMADGYYPKHTINFGFMFGGISNENKVFDYYLGYNFNRAKEAYERRDYITARQQFEEILAIYPDHAPSKEYLKKIVYDLDTQDRNLNLQINKWLRRADLELFRNNLVKSRNYYYRVLGIDPENAEAEAGLSKISAKLAEVEVRENRKKNKDKIVALWSEAMQYYNDGNFVFAKDKLKELLDMDPENAGALQYMAAIDKQVSKVTNMQADKLFTQGMDYYNIADYERAAQYFNAVYASDPSRTDAKEYYELSKKALNLSYTELSKKAAADQKQKTRLADKDDSVLSSNQKIQKEMENAYNQAVELYNKGRYDEALHAFVAVREKAVSNSYYDLNQSIKDYTAKIKDIIADKYYKEALALIQNNKQDEAIEKLNKALDYNEKNAAAQREKEKVMNDLAQKYYDAGIKAYAAGDKKKAIGLLEKSLEYNPNKAETNKALDRIKLIGG